MVAAPASSCPQGGAGPCRAVLAPAGRLFPFLRTSPSSAEGIPNDWFALVALLVFGLCLVYALPSVPYIGTALENVLPSKKINLGLDLKGGIHLTLGVDVAKAVSNSLALAGQDIRRLAKDEKIVVMHPRVVGNDKL